MNFMKSVGGGAVVVREGEDVSDKVCVFCLKCDNDWGRFGPMYCLNGIFLHYFCVLFSYSMLQRGSDDEGIFGFRELDILFNLNAERAAGRKCEYCGDRLATVRCATDSCTATYHFVCGRKSGCRFEFCGPYKSYCSDHAPKPRRKPSLTMTCEICTVSGDPEDAIRTCCCENDLHRYCLQNLAWRQGYFFRCPHCMDKYEKNFRRSMPRIGVFIPQCDLEHFVEEYNMKAQNSVALPPPFKTVCLERECSIMDYTKIRHGHPTPRSFIISTSTPVAQVISKVGPHDPLTWSTSPAGGSFCSTYKGDGLECGFMRLNSKEEIGPEQNDALRNRELVLVSPDAGVTFGMVDSGMVVRRPGGGLSVLSIPPGESYSVQNGNDKAVALFSIYKSLISTDSVEKRRASPRWGNGDGRVWAVAQSGGEDLFDVEQSFAWGTDDRRGFFNLEKQCSLPFQINESGEWIFLVVHGEIKLRSTNYEDFENSENEMETCLTTETLGQGSSFVVGPGCCFAVENHNESDRAVIFYDQLR